MAIDWIKLTKDTVPEEGSYLVTGKGGPTTCCDVAYYNGLSRDGSHWWTVTDVNIDPRMITHYARINLP